MADLIDRQELLKGVCNACDGWCENTNCDCLNCESDHRCDIVNDIIYAPAVDAVEVVRCKDCKHISHLQGAKDEAYVCALGWGLRGIVAEEDFCSYGKRREENG